MSKPPKVTNDVTTMYDASLWIDQFGSGDKIYYRGVVFTPQGIVAIYRQYDEDYTKLHFCWEGRWYTRNIAAAYSDRYTITLARRFAEEIAGDE